LDGDRPVVTIFQRPADLQRRAGHGKHLLRLHCFDVPHHHGVAEAFHRFGVFDDLTQGPVVVVVAGEARGEHHVLAGVDGDVIAITVAFHAADLGGGHVVRGDHFAGVVERRHAGLAVFGFGVRQPRHQHAAGQRVKRVRPEQAGFLAEGLDGVGQLRLRGVLEVEYVDVVVGQATGPEVAAVVGEAHVVRLAAPFDRHAVHHLAVLGRLRVHVNCDEFVVAVAQALHAQRPHMYEIFLAGDELAHVGRVAGFVGQGWRSQQRERRADRGEEVKSGASFHGGGLQG
jgi:hypothetical protein